MQLLGEAPGLLGFLFRDDIAYEDDALKGLPANAGRCSWHPWEHSSWCPSTTSPLRRCTRCRRH
jgi:hypothetical protein